MMDYRLLLKKYMAFICKEEGVSYITHIIPDDDGWTEEELAELKKIEHEVGD